MTNWKNDSWSNKEFADRGLHSPVIGTPYWEDVDTSFTWLKLKNPRASKGQLHVWKAALDHHKELVKEAALAHLEVWQELAKEVGADWETKIEKLVKSDDDSDLAELYRDFLTAKLDHIATNIELSTIMRLHITDPEAIVRFPDPWVEILEAYDRVERHAIKWGAVAA